MYLAMSRQGRYFEGFREHVKRGQVRKPVPSFVS